MSKYVLPELAGLDITVTRKPKFSTKIQTAVSGKEKRVSYWSYPKFSFKISYEVLFAEQARNDFATIMGFFLARQGSFDTWLFDCPNDNHITDQVLGISDGVQNTFQLANNIGGFVFPILDIKPNPIVKVNDVVVTNYTISDDGLLVFVNPLNEGDIVKASFGFYYRVRFDKDEIEFERFAEDLYSLKSFEFISVK